jgi:hypothetical protein
MVYREGCKGKCTYDDVASELLRLQTSIELEVCQSSEVGSRLVL